MPLVPGTLPCGVRVGKEHLVVPCLHLGEVSELSPLSTVMVLKTYEKCSPYSARRTAMASITALLVLLGMRMAR